MRQNLFHFSKSFLQGSRPSLSAQRLKISIEQALGGHKHQLLTSYYHIVIILLTDKTPEIHDRFVSAKMCYDYFSGIFPVSLSRFNTSLGISSLLST
jgi:hypothetical protein